MQVPDGDVLLFGGDAGLSSRQHAVVFNAWLQALPHSYKVVTFGNMDSWAEQNFDASVLSAATHVLVNEAADVAGFRIFASPHTPQFFGSFQIEDMAAGGAASPPLAHTHSPRCLKTPPRAPCQYCQTATMHTRCACKQITHRPSAVSPSARRSQARAYDAGMCAIRGDVSFDCQLLRAHADHS